MANPNEVHVSHAIDKPDHDAIQAIAEETGESYGQVLSGIIKAGVVARKAEAGKKVPPGLAKQVGGE